MKRTCILIAILASMTLYGCSSNDPAPAAQTDNTPVTQEEEPEPEFVVSTVNIYGLFEEAGLPVGDYIDYTEETDPNAAMNKKGQYTGKLNFQITTLEQFDEDSPAGGSIEIFENRKDAQARKDYIDSIGESMPMLAESSEIVLDRVLIRIDRQITASETQKYFDVFEGM